MSADWSGTPIPIPYADFRDPQTLNLYSYTRGLPTTHADIDGHGWWTKLKNSFNEANCWCEDNDPRASANRKAAQQWAEQVESMKRDPAFQQSFFLMLFIASDGLDVLMPGEGSVGSGTTQGVSEYEVGTYGALRNRSVVGDRLTLDHIPSNASNIARAESELGRPLTQAERSAVRDEGTAVAVPEVPHRSASPT